MKAILFNWEPLISNDKIIITGIEIGWRALNCRHFFPNNEASHPLFFFLSSPLNLSPMTLSQLMKNSYRNDDILIPSLASFSVYSIYPCWELCFSWLANANSGVATRPLWSSRWRSSSFSSISFWGGKKKIGNMRIKILGIKKHVCVCVSPLEKKKKNAFDMWKTTSRH